MKEPSLVLSLLCLVPLALHAAGQDGTDTTGSALVRCGAEQVATFDGAQSRDERFAVGWTIRAKGNQKAPAPWVTCDQDVPAVVAGMRVQNGTEQIRANARNCARGASFFRSKDQTGGT